MRWYNGQTGVGVTASKEDIIRDQNERNNLQNAIAAVETARAVSTPGTRSALTNFLEGAKKRVAVLEKKIEDTTREREAEMREQVAAIAQLAENEARLSEEEKKTYSGFLAKEFFTKHDFKALEQFYAHTWNRLSEDGKDEMSHRIWEGVRRDEYKFTELPEIVQEKEAKLAYKKLTADSINQSALAQIPDVDCKDFVEAYRSGDHKKAFHVLDRDSFKRNMALATSTGTKHETADIGKAVDDQAAVTYVKTGVERTSKPLAASATTAQFEDIKLDTEKLKDVALANSFSTPSAASMPNASGSRVNER
jgi:hypothetical protein